MKEIKLIMNDDTFNFVRSEIIAKQLCLAFYSVPDQFTKKIIEAIEKGQTEIVINKK